MMNSGKEDTIYGWIEWIPNVVLLGVLWLLTSLPLFTIGASTTALYSCFFQFRQDHRRKLIPLFFEQFKFHFKQATIIWLICFPTAVVLGIELLYCIENSEELIFVLSGTAVGVLFTFLSLVLVTVFAYLARFENTITKTILKSLQISLKDFFRSALNLVLLISITFLIVSLFPQFLLIYGGIICFVLSINFEQMFKKNIPGGRGSKRF